jgi:hypothetical protein
MSASFCVSLSCERRGFAVGRPLVQGVLPNIEKGSEMWQKVSPEDAKDQSGQKRLKHALRLLDAGIRVLIAENISSTIV